MAENSKIAWTDHTFNPWIGCTKVSDGCKFCYAEELMDKRYGKVKWGPQGTRVRTAKANWRKPVQWNKATWLECDDCGWRGSLDDLHYFNEIGRCPNCDPKSHFHPTRQRVFCASLADVFEANEQLDSWRQDLFTLMYATPNLDWLLLTKRPENITALAPGYGLPDNAWLGTTVESQEHFESRVSALLEIPARVHWLSVEPMIGPVHLPHNGPVAWAGTLNWVIAGGESGARCRPMDLQWARELRDDCRVGGVSFFMKQLGGYPDKRDQMSDFPEDLRIREFPE